MSPVRQNLKKELNRKPVQLIRPGCSSDLATTSPPQLTRLSSFSTMTLCIPWPHGTWTEAASSRPGGALLWCRFSQLRLRARLLPRLPLLGWFLRRWPRVLSSAKNERNNMATGSWLTTKRLMPRTLTITGTGPLNITCTDDSVSAKTTKQN